ncbi:MAG TPA: hypothetical protein VHB98_00610 [Chloroflexota bacterium]|nr:hypothetical protein [Chloroflexota bacterium]
MYTFAGAASSQAEAALHTARPHAARALEQAAPDRLAPARVDLVENFDSGALYLRAFVHGHFLWQPVTGTLDTIPDSGVWMTGKDFHDSYWFNHGPYRRRAGRYHPGEQQATTTFRVPDQPAAAS